MKGTYRTGASAVGDWATWITNAQFLQDALTGGGLVRLSPAANLSALAAPASTGTVTSEVYRFDDELQGAAPVVLEFTYGAVRQGDSFGLSAGVRLASRYENGTLIGAGAARWVGVAYGEGSGAMYAASSENGLLLSFGATYNCNLWVTRLALPTTNTLVPDVLIAQRTLLTGPESTSAPSPALSTVRRPTLNLELSVQAWPGPLLNTSSALSASGDALILNGPVLVIAGQFYSLTHRRALLVGLSADALNVGATQDVTLDGVTGTYLCAPGTSVSTSLLGLSGTVRGLIRLT